MIWKGNKVGVPTVNTQALSLDVLLCLARSLLTPEIPRHMRTKTYSTQ